MDAKTQQQYAETFHGLHMKGDPLILFNAWSSPCQGHREDFAGRCDQ